MISVILSFPSHVIKEHCCVEWRPDVNTREIFKKFESLYKPLQILSNFLFPLLNKATKRSNTSVFTQAHRKCGDHNSPRVHILYDRIDCLRVVCFVVYLP